MYPLHLWSVRLCICVSQLLSAVQQRHSRDWWRKQRWVMQLDQRTYECNWRSTAGTCAVIWKWDHSGLWLRMFGDRAWATGCAFLGPVGSSVEGMGEMQMGERAGKIYWSWGWTDNRKAISRQTDSRHREGEPISYVLAAVTKDLTRSIFQQEELFQAYSLRRGDL